MQNFDLHNHSTASDGLLAPAKLIDLAVLGRCDAFALTDHDTTAGLAEAAQAAQLAELRFIPGVEVSVTWPAPGSHPDTRPTTIHVVGLAIDPAHPTLAAGIDSIRRGRIARARQIDADLARIGIEGTFEAAMAQADNKDMIGRTHFARVLVERGLAQSTGKVFARYLATGKPGYVAHVWAPLAEAVNWIDAAGGVAVLAHPGRYNLSIDEMYLLLDEFKAAGGRAIEIVTGSHQPKHTQEYAGLARRFGLAGSRGADYHGPGESPYQPGELPPLPDGVTPVWNLFQ